MQTGCFDFILAKGRVSHKDRIFWPQVLFNAFDPHSHQRTPLTRTKLFGGRGVPIRGGPLNL